MFEKLVGATVTQWNEYLFAGGEMVGEHFSRSDATEFLRYFVKDHLGSIAVLTDESGAVTERLSFDAWGKRRYADGTDDPTGSITSETTRGFTGHEMIDDVDIVNMNGRIYDPQIGRFMSADPFIHEVTNSQDLNRYSYVHNNPLSYTDMNGYGFFKSIGNLFKKLWKPLLAIAVAIAIVHFGPLAFGLEAGATIGGTTASTTLSFGQAAIISGVSGGVSNVILTGKPKAFLAGFGQAFATFGVAHGLFPSPKVKPAFGSGIHIRRTVANAVIGGTFAEVRGGNFSSGFLSAGFASAAGPLGPQDFWGGFAFHSVTGGVGSLLGGGKFGSGVTTAAYTYLFNAAAERAIRGPISLREARDIAANEAGRATKLTGKEQSTITYFDPATGSHFHTPLKEGHPGSVQIDAYIPTGSRNAREHIHSHDVATIPSQGSVSGLDGGFAGGSIPGYVTGWDGKACIIRPTTYGCPY